MFGLRSSSIGVLLLAAAAVPQGSWALVEPDVSGTVAEKQFVHEDLDIAMEYQSPNQLPPQAAAQARASLKALSAPPDSGKVDVRGGRFSTVTPVKSMVPGRGVGNKLKWDNDNGPPPHSQAFKDNAWGAFRGYLEENAQNLQIDMGEIASPLVTVPENGEKVQIYAPRVVNGVPVRGSFMSATMSHGNLILFGCTQWGDIDVSTEPTLTESEATSAVQSYADKFPITGSWEKSSLVIIPKARGRVPSHVEFKNGYSHSLAWAINPKFESQDVSQYEALVDAHTGEVLSFQDKVDYLESKGGVLPVTNDGIVPDGVEQPSWPMPFDLVSTSGGTETTDSGGNGGATGSVTSTLSGKYVTMNDNCGSISLTSSSGELDFGTSGGTDCTTPGKGGAGNTHASRSGFYELNRIIAMGRSHLPNNSWLQSRLTSNMNINADCNAYWNGEVNFYTSGGGCANTGEIAGVFDHEWGHGMDANDATPGIASPSGEGIADIYTALRLNDSCIGRNFLSSVCSGNGDPCDTCTGVRDIDYMKRSSKQPHDYSWSNANCGTSVHCKGGVYSEAVWSLWKRKLQAAPYNYDDHTAHEIVTRLTFIGAGATGTWFSGTAPNGGCAATNGYMNYLAADDDNGNLNDGTPHMQAIYDAFNDQEIACGSPTVQDSGCAGTPNIAPTVASTPLDKGAYLSWTAVTGASSYDVFRTDGVFACDFGKEKVGSGITGTSFEDSGLQNGRDYSYVVIPKGSVDSCFAPASSCETVTPIPGPNLAINPASTIESITTGDGDDFIDNCEDVTVTFDVRNTGAGTLNNVRITDVVSTSHHPATAVASYTVSTTSLAEGVSGTGSFDFKAGGLAFGDTLIFEVSYTADEMGGIEKKQAFAFANTETNLQRVSSKTWDFDADMDGWTAIEGTFGRSTTGGGAGGSAGYLQSSANLDNQCDKVRSPTFRLTATSTLTMFTNYDIEANGNGQWWDRGNVGILDNGARSVVIPDGGRTYNAQAGSPPCNVGDRGWANSATSWASSSWSAPALGSSGLVGKTVQLEVAYGTDPSVNGYGLRFDQVTVTNVDALVADGQDDTCSCTVDDDCSYCNGETCNTNTGECIQTLSPPTCDDGVGCTDDSCNDGTRSCIHIPIDTNCAGGSFCFPETCNATLDCQAATPLTCDDGVACTVDTCNDTTEQCDNTPDCNLGEICDEVSNTCVACNNNGVCDSGETCLTCPNDCISGTSSGDICGNGVCEAGDGEDCVSCPADCNGVQGGNPQNRFCCGDGVLCGDARCFEGGLGCMDTPAPAGDYCCGDSMCEGDEKSSNCLIDCPDPCGNGIIDSGEVCDGEEFGIETCATNGCTGGTLTCTDGCSIDTTSCTGCTSSCGGNRATCSISSDCCSSNCSNGSCKGNGRRLGYDFDSMHGKLRGAR